MVLLVELQKLLQKSLPTFCHLVLKLIKTQIQKKSDLANRLRQVATDLGANLRDVDRESSTGARVVADNAQRDLVSEINAMANTIKNYIDPKGKGENRRVLQLEEIIDRARAAAS